ncbi:MAG: transposase, partial [Actinobacteria bacterium]|nr:transposase [Actinomycetota bacterium]
MPEPVGDLASTSWPARTSNPPATTEGTWRIAQRVTPDRVLSVVDPESRHVHKTVHNYRDGYKAHAAAEPETGLITDVAITPGNTPDAETAPTIFRGRIAFARTYRSGAGPIVYTKRLVAPRSRPSRRLPGVPQRRQGKPTESRSVAGLELVGDSLGQSVTYDFAGAAGFRQNEIRLVDVEDATSRQVARM